MQLLPALDGGGVERGTLEIAAALVDAGHRAIVVSGGGRMHQELIELGAESVILDIGRKSPMTLLRARLLADLIRETGPDVVHARSRLPAWVAVMALKRLARRPAFVTTLHGLNSVNRYSRIMTSGDRVIAVSETARDYWLSNYPKLDPDRVTVIHRGIDSARFPFGHRPSDSWIDRFKTDFGIPPGRRLLCLPGRITRLKGHENFLVLLAALADQGLDVHGLAVGGRGREGLHRELEARAAQLGVSDRISWVGHRDDVREVMALSDLVLSLSSRPESFGRTVVEALALGRPVAGWNHGGVGEVLASIYPQGRAPLNDNKALLEVVSGLLQNPPPVPDRQPFLLQEFTARTLELYQSLVH
jgi:glycosyltransferase involved in cell wall biosynthesis